MIKFYLTEADDNGDNDLVTEEEYTTPQGFTLQRINNVVTLTGCENVQALSKLIIPKGVKAISTRAFSMCSNLTELVIDSDSTLESIGDYAFYGLPKLSTVRCLSNTLNSIGTGAFFSCRNLTDVSFNDGLQYIKDKAFYACFSLPTIDLPASITELGNGAFAQCLKLSSVTVNGEELNENSGIQLGSNVFRYDEQLPQELQQLHNNNTTNQVLTPEQQQISDQINQMAPGDNADNENEFNQNPRGSFSDIGTLEELNNRITEDYSDDLSEYIARYIEHVDMNDLSGLSGTDIFDTLCNNAYDYITSDRMKPNLSRLINDIFKGYRTSIIDVVSNSDTSNNSNKAFSAYCNRYTPVYVNGIQAITKPLFNDIFIDNTKQLTYQMLKQFANV